MSSAELKIKAARQTVRHTRHLAGPRTLQQPNHQPIVVRTSEARQPGIRSFSATRYVVGYVLSGRKFIYTGDVRHEAGPGDLFFLAKGTHYIEEVPEGRQPFEQIMFFYSSEQIGRIIATLSVNYSLDICVHHSCDACMLREFVISPGWDGMRNFLDAIDRNLRDGVYAGNPTAELLSLAMLTYQIVSRPEGCLRTRVLGSTDPEKELMERMLHDYIVSGLSLEQFARHTNRSLSSFKKKFKEYYHEPPHRWVIRQRLMYARSQIILSDHDVALVAAQCGFANSSYFIRLFRAQFGVTPATYREKYRGAKGAAKKGTKVAREGTGNISTR
jgi:AraC-like DNA-binding protein